MGMRLVDFGNSISLTETDTGRVVHEVQTLQYRAPEVIWGKGLLGQTDNVWGGGNCENRLH